MPLQFLVSKGGLGVLDERCGVVCVSGPGLDGPACTILCMFVSSLFVFVFCALFVVDDEAMEHPD